MDRKIGIILSLTLMMVTVSISAVTGAHLRLNDRWDDFKKTFNKIYDGNETEEKKRLIWESNMQLIAEHNRKADLGLYTYRLGINEYADLDHTEFSMLKSGIPPHAMELNSSTIMSKSVNVSDLPKEVDWRKKGYVTEVKNQKDCGGCWAFSATGSLEGQHFKKTGVLLSLSEQEILDCCSDDGCSGGLMTEAFDCIRTIGGIEKERSYNFVGINKECRFQRYDVVARVKDYTTIEPFCEDCLQIAVATVGPISAAVFSKEKTFHLYKSGIYQSPTCSQTMTHGILVVGYGTENGQDYWLVKNSWGPTWGLQGYIKIARNQDNMCGISSMASFPIIR